MRRVELGGSMECLIATGAYENQRVFLHFKESLEGEFTDQELIEKQKHLFKTHIADLIEAQEQELIAKSVQKEFKHLRILKCPKCSKLHPSITTIRDFDSKGFYCTDEQLDIAIAEGTIQDLRCRNYVSTGKWLTAEEIPSCKPHVLVLKGKKTGYNDFNFEAFLKEYPITDMVSPERMWDCENEITFESDLLGTTSRWNVGSKKDPIILADLPTVFDYKRNVDKDSAFTQMSVAAKMLGLQRMVAIPVNGETEKGYSKPVISNDVSGYFEIAMDKRKKFRKRYGI